MKINIPAENIKWKPSGLSIEPEVENFDLHSVNFHYKYSYGEQLDEGGTSDVENPTSYNYSNRPHILKIKWQETLKRVIVTATDNYRNTACCEADIPRTPGKINISMACNVYFNIACLRQLPCVRISVWTTMETQH